MATGSCRLRAKHAGARQARSGDDKRDASESGKRIPLLSTFFKTLDAVKHSL
jgi:hypothetical protein